MERQSDGHIGVDPQISSIAFELEAFMARFSDLPQDRQDTLIVMAPGRTWIQRTDPDVLRKLMTLGYQQNPSDAPDGPAEWNKLADWDKFVAATLDQADVIGTAAAGETRVVALADVRDANFVGVPIFDVISPKGLRYQYELARWRHGPTSGAKGLVAVLDEAGDPVGLLMRHGARFATGNRMLFDMAGGFAEPEDRDQLNGLAANFLREVHEELGVTEIDNITSLGTMLTDPGMTDNEPGIFIATVKAALARSATESGENSDVREISGNTVLVPFDQLRRLLQGNQSDGLLHTAILRAMSNGEVPERIRKALLQAVVGSLAASQTVTIDTASIEVPSKKRATSAWARAARAALALTYPLQFPFMIASDLTYEARMVRQERSAQGRPYPRGTGVVRSIPRAATWMVGQGLRDSLELAATVRNFAPSKPIRPRVPDRSSKSSRRV